jgi:glucose/arabinose dehydrogenase
MTVRALAPIAVALLLGVFACLLLAKPAVTEPVDGFSDDPVADVTAPTALAFIPDGDMLVASRPGQVRVYEEGNPPGALVLDIPRVCTNKERGLLGLAVDPAFGTEGNNYIYVYYTYRKYDRCVREHPESRKNPVNRVSRFEMTGNSAEGSTEDILINNIPSPNGNHNGGDLHFGKDGNLYVSVGDGGCDYAKPHKCQYENNASRDRNIALGKVLRIEADGDVPPDNPYAGDTSNRCADDGRTARGENCPETFAIGFRNPFRMAFDPNTVGTDMRFFINDVGGQRWEEIDEGEPGADYGWNLCEGNHDNPFRRGQVNCDGPAYTGPIHEYNHDDTNCESVTGGAFVPNNSSWPAEYDDSYLFGDYICNKIFRLEPDGSDTRFATVGGGGPIAMEFGPPDTVDKDLYYTTFAGGGQVRRISYTGAP